MFTPGFSFDRYTVEDVLGQGGMGCVYRAYDARLDRRVALKVMLGDGEDPEHRTQAKARLLREARAAAALDHPNAVSIYDIGEVDGMPYIAMELVLGRTLRGLMEDASVHPRERLAVLLDVARALAAAHRAGLVHRDVKPENVMVRADGRVKVLDFGIARRSAAEVDERAPTQSPALATLTAKGVQVGTPMYMAPEQIRGEPIDGRADQFAWGVLAYEVLSGQVPWKSHDALSLVAAILTQEPAPPSLGEALPGGVGAVLWRALAKAPADRFSSMDEVVRALEPHLAGASAAPSPGGAGSGSGAGPRGGLGAGPRGGFGAGPPANAQPRATDLRRYSTAELREVMHRALERQGERPKYSHSDLVEAAREVGIDEAALRVASQELNALKHLPSPAVERARERQMLLRHVGIYLVFSVFFLLLDLLTAGGKWFFFPVLAWGVGVAVHAVKYLFPVDPSPEEAMWRRARFARRRGWQMSERDLEQGVSMLMTATERRARVAGEPVRAAPGVRVRVSAPAAPEPGAAGGDELVELEEERAGEKPRRARRS